MQPLGLSDGSQAPHREVSMAVRSEPCSSVDVGAISKMGEIGRKQVILRRGAKNSLLAESCAWAAPH